MIKEISLRVLPQVAASDRLIRQQLAGELSLAEIEIEGFCVIKRSIDARQRAVYINLTLRVYINEPVMQEDMIKPYDYPDVSSAKSVIVVGAGPGGLFAALRLIELGYKPILLERGREVSDRRRDIALITREQQINPESNYSFGEGGAGAFSDGKLYTRSKKRGSVDRVLQVFCRHGASSSILIDAHPHIGTDKLPAVIVAMREQIKKAGGEVYFQTKMTALILHNNQVIGVTTADGREFRGAVILATGHSARDVYEYLFQSNIKIEAKSIAVGARLEHPQSLIDQIQYHSANGRGDYLPAAEYTMVTQAKDRGVYSFCMCPGGVVVPAATDRQQIVVNGMSASNRGSQWANSGMVVECRVEDLDSRYGKDALSVMRFQIEMEHQAWLNGGMKQTAPAQRMTDFVNRKVSSTLAASSYSPGLLSSPLHFWMPEFISDRLRDGLSQFGAKYRGFLTQEATLIGVETRTSSAVRIVRDRETLQHVELLGLYPCGEGAGYAGGIVSAAIDGERCAEQLVAWLER